MRVVEEVIGPKQAQHYLDTCWVKEKQRTPSLRVVEDYARTMRAGQWMLTHQGIAIDTNGELIDGVHRLLAIVQSGVPVQMLVTRGVTAVEATSGMYAIDAVDRGRLRGVGQQLQLRHGFQNGNIHAATAWTVLAVACHHSSLLPGRASTSKALAVLEVFGDQIGFCVSNRPQLPKLRLASTLGAFAFAMRIAESDVRPAFIRFAAGEGLVAGDPMLVLRNFMLALPPGGGSNPTLTNARATLHALQCVVERRELRAIRSTVMTGVNFFVEAQHATVEKLLMSCGYKDNHTQS